MWKALDRWLIFPGEDEWVPVALCAFCMGIIALTLIGFPLAWVLAAIGSVAAAGWVAAAITVVTWILFIVIFAQRTRAEHAKAVAEGNRYGNENFFVTTPPTTSGEGH